MEFSAIVLTGAGFIGLVVGLLTGIFGVGGGFLMTPALMIILGVPGHIAVGTGLATILVNSSVGIIKRKGSGTMDFKLAGIISAGSVSGVLFGSYVLDILKDAPKFVLFGKEQEPLRYGLLAMFIILLIGIAGYLYYDYRKNGGKSIDKRIGLFAHIKMLPYMHFDSLDISRLSVWPLLFFGFAIGVLTGLLGIGGGVVLLPGLIYLVGQRTAKAAGTSLILVWLPSLVGVIRKGASGQIAVCLFAALLAGGIIGTFGGTKIGLKLPGAKIRLYFVYVVVAAVVMIGYELFRMSI